MRFTLFLCFSFSLTFCYSQKQNGPIIKNYGSVFQVDNPDYQLDTNKVYKVVFDIMKSPENKSTLNSSINTIARFLNMHAQSGVPKENLCK